MSYNLQDWDHQCLDCTIPTQNQGVGTSAKNIANKSKFMKQTNIQIKKQKQKNKQGASGTVQYFKHCTY